MEYKYTDSKGEHLHTLHGRPLLGTSTVVGILNKPLTWWASGMALKSLGWTNPKLTKREEGIKIAAKARKFFFINNEEYYDWLQECYRAHNDTKNKAASDGTDMHAELEKYVKICLSERNGEPFDSRSDHPAVQTFSKWSLENVDRFIWSEANCYSESLWVGGITDAGAKMKDGHTAIIDFKSSKDAYFSQFVQIGGYAQQIEENGLYTADGVKTHEPVKIDALIVFPFGGSVPRTVYAVEDYQRAFLSATVLYKLNQNFES